MVAKVSAARKDLFLATLRETGNQTLAAERAKVSSSWVQLHRSSDSAFRRAVAEAVEQAKAGLRQAQALRQAQDERAGCEPPRGWGFLDGEELVVRGTGGSALRQAQGERRRGGPQIARARLRQWSPRAEERFLSVLTATCNVKAACAEVGLTSASAYNHRRRWAAFARRWDEAIEIGFCQLDYGLIAAACNLFSGEGLPDVQPLRGMTVEHAKHVLHMHQRRVHGIGKRPGRRPREPDIEDVRAEILRKVEAIERARGLGPGGGPAGPD